MWRLYPWSLKPRSQSSNAPAAFVGARSAAGDLRQQRIGAGEIQCQADTDQIGGVDQTDEQEHLRLQLRRQLRLASSSFEKFRTHHADADAGASGTQTDHQPGSDRGMGLNKGNCVHSLLGLLVEFKQSA